MNVEFCEKMIVQVLDQRKKDSRGNLYPVSMTCSDLKKAIGSRVPIAIIRDAVNNLVTKKIIKSNGKMIYLTKNKKPANTYVLVKWSI